MRDVTHILMGDPITAVRRAPTPEEVARLPYTRWDFAPKSRVHQPNFNRPKRSVIWTLSVGDRHKVQNKAQAISMRQRMMNVKMLAKIEKCDGGYFVVRTA